MFNKKVVQFGAGNIGRGFLAQLFTQSGSEVVFVEVIPEVVKALNTRRSYVLRLVGDNPQDILIKNVRAVPGQDIEAVSEEIVSSGLVATAVGVKYLPAIIPALALGIKKRKDKNISELLNIIICENLLQAGEVLKNYLLEELPLEYHPYLEEKIGFVETVVSRMIPVVPSPIRARDPLLVMAEEYSILPVMKKGFKGIIPEIKGLLPKDNFPAYEEQKLFIHNLGHASSAYFGYLKGYEFIWQAIEDGEIRKKVEGVLQESGTALNKKHNFTTEEQDAHIQDLLKRFANRALGDTVARVGRDPWRKLGSNDRLIGAARLCLEQRIKPEKITLAIAGCLCYNNKIDPEAVQLVEMLENEGLDGVLTKVCEVQPDSQLGQMIKSSYHYLKEQYHL